MHKEFFEILKKDHAEVKGMFEQLQKSTGKKSTDLFQKLKMELIPHMKAEEKTFYSELEQKKEAREETLEGFEEHHVATMVLKELDKMKPDADRWAAKLSVLKELVDHHVQEEESELFAAAEKALKPDQIEQIMEKFNKAKEQFKKQLS